MNENEPEPSFDPDRGVYLLECDWQEVDPGMAVVESVASVLSRDVLDLSPLQNVVDIDGLEVLLHTDSLGPLSLEFEYEGTVVELTRAGQLVIEVLERT